MHWARKAMSIETAKLVSKLPCEAMDAMEISGVYWSGMQRWKSFESLHYPEFDICADCKLYEAYDIIFAEQVFEHLPFPNRAARNVRQLLRPAGYFLLTVPFLIRIHKFPLDCTRWTPEGLKFFLMESGFEASRIQTYSWGNRECVISNFDKWTKFNRNIHSLENDLAFPVVVWGLAQK